MKPPAPLTPPDCNLRDFPFMPWEIVRFRQSALVAQEDPEAILAAILLWGEAWTNVPAASLADDDKALARAAGYGRAVEAFQKVKAGALRGFVKCSDGRLYHPVVAEKARTAWDSKLKQRWRSHCGAIRMHNSRNPNDQRTAPSLESWLQSGQAAAAETAAPATLQGDLSLESDAQPAAMLRATEATVARTLRGESGPRDIRSDRDTLIKEESQSPTHSETAKPNEVSMIDRGQLLDATNRLARVGGVPLNPSRLTAFNAQLDIVKAWIADGIDLDKTAVPAIAGALSKTNEDRIGSLKFFDAAVRKAHALTIAPKSNGKTFKASNAAPRPQKPLATPDQDDDRVKAIRADLARTCGQSVYDGWLAPGLTSISIEGDELQITTRAGFIRSWIADNVNGQIAAAAMAAIGSDKFDIRSQ